MKYICFTLWFWLKKVLLFRGGECYKWPSLGYNTAPLLSSDKWIDVYHPMSYKGSWFYYFLIILPFCTCSQTQSSLWWKQGVQTRYFEASRELNSNLSSATQQLAGLGCIAGSIISLCCHMIIEGANSYTDFSFWIDYLGVALGVSRQLAISAYPGLTSISMTCDFVLYVLGNCCFETEIKAIMLLLVMTNNRGTWSRP